MANLEPKIPERHENAVHQLAQGRERPGADHHLAVMEEHDVEITQRIEFATAIASERHQGEGREFLLSLG